MTLGIIVVVLIIVIVYRFFCSAERKGEEIPFGWGHAEFVGDRQIQADCGDIIRTTAGTLAVLADGIGKEKRGRISSYIAVESVISLFKGYQVLSNPMYFFRRAYQYVNREILKTLDGREGGASMACTVIIGDTLYYVLAGNIQIAVYRNGVLIPLSEGQTLNKLAENAYKKGRITKQKAVYAMKDERLYNYVGQDGFKEIELYDTPVHLKNQDRIVLMTKGIYETLPWQALEEALGDSSMSAANQADAIVSRFENMTQAEDRDNGSVIIIAVSQSDN